MKSSKRPQLAWMGGIGLFIIIISISVWFTLTIIPPLREQIPQNSASSALTIISPADHSSYPADASIPILITATSELPLSSLELWVNGQLVMDLQPGETSGEHYAGKFHWTPFKEQNASILVRSINNAGQITTSNPITIDIREPAGLRLIARGENPDLVEQIIYPLEGAAPTDPAIPDLPSQPDQLLPPAEPGNSDLAFFLAKRFSVNTSQPAAPGLSYMVDDCTVTLIVMDQADNELGFFIYRASPGEAAFERIAELGKMELKVPFSYPDPSPESKTIYYAAAYNQAGESPSEPILVDLLGSSCEGISGEGSDQDHLDKDLEILDLAYFYYSFNGSSYLRFPQDPQGFLTPSEYPTSLRALVRGLAAASPIPVSSADLVVWGWSGGSLLNMGAFHLKVDDSRLSVCNLGTGCSGDAASGFRASYGELANDSEDQVREMYWSTTASGTSSVLWQISTTPFSDDFSPHPYGLVGAGCADGEIEGSFLVNFRALDDYLPAPASCGGYSQPWIEYSKFSWAESLQPQFEKRYYLRIIPMAGSQPAGKPSNTVEILAKPGESFIEPVIVDHLPEIYEVEIVDFVPIKNMDPQYWGCVFITGLDYDVIWNYYRTMNPPTTPDSIIDQLATKIYGDMNYAVQNNLIVCPAPYNQSSDSGSVLSEWGSMFVEGLAEVWDTVVSAFNALKEGIVDVAAGVINELGIPCDSECKAGLKLGLEIGMTYFTGIPPNLPSFEQLADQGIAYAIEMAAAEAGIPCPEACQEVLREGLEEVVDLVAQNNSQPGCVGENWANVLGKHSLCLPPGVETEAVPEGVHEPARAFIHVSRTGQEAAVQYKYGDQPAYNLNVHFTSENTKLSGQTIPYMYHYMDWGSGFQKFFSVEAPVTKLQNDVFDSQTLPIPPLEPGEDIIIPLSLTPHSYYIPEHVHSLMIELNSLNLELGDVGGIGGSRGPMFDWTCLLDGGLIKIEADISCLSMPAGLIGNTQPDENSQQVPCGAAAVPLLYQDTKNACYP